MHFRVGLIGIVATFLASAAQAEEPSAQVRQLGEKVYKSTCAACHDNPEGRTPPRSALVITRSPDHILRVLNEGVMKAQAAGLTSDQKVAVAAYLVDAMPGSKPAVSINANMCRDASRPLKMNAPSWNGWGGSGVTNLRYQRDGRITAANVGKLKLKWTFALPVGTFSQATVADGRVFVPSLSGVIFALDARTGCTYWATDVGAPTRSAIAPPRSSVTIRAGYTRSTRRRARNSGRRRWKTMRWSV